MILGHAHPAVIAGGGRAHSSSGSSFGAPTIREIEIAEMVAAAVPSIEKVRFVSSGTEASMSAVRLARGVTGRSKIIKMTGHYHGHVDALLVQAGSAATTLGTPNSPGVTEGAVQDTILCPFNDVRAVADVLARFPGQVAAVILEPIAGNMGLVPPRPGYLAALRELTDKRRQLAHLRRGDDRLPRGLWRRPGTLRYHTRHHRARQDRRRRPARRGLRCFGRAHEPTLAGRPDLPGRHALRKSAGDGGRAGHPSTRSVTTLRTSGSSALGAAGRRARPRRHRRRIPHVVQRTGSMLTLFFHDGPVHDYDDALQSDTRLFARFFWEMLARGVYLPCSQFEAAFVSAAHTEDDIDRTIEAAREALRRIVRALKPRTESHWTTTSGGSMSPSPSKTGALTAAFVCSPLARIIIRVFGRICSFERRPSAERRPGAGSASAGRRRSRRPAWRRLPVRGPAFSSVIPPMANQGSEVASAARRTYSRPASSGSENSLVCAREDGPDPQIARARQDRGIELDSVVGRDTDERGRAQDPPGVARRQVVLAKVHAVAAREPGKVDPVVHDQRHPRLGRQDPDLAGAAQQLAVRQALFPDTGSRRRRRPALRPPSRSARRMVGSPPTKTISLALPSPRWAATAVIVSFSRV